MLEAAALSLESHTEERTTERLLSPQELSDFLGLGLTSTYGLLSSGAIPSVRIGRLRKVRRSDVDKFVEDRLEGSGE
jgi:excisionase family DNA binding protein